MATDTLVCRSQVHVLEEGAEDGSADGDGDSDDQGDEETDTEGTSESWEDEEEDYEEDDDDDDSEDNEEDDGEDNEDEQHSQQQAWWMFCRRQQGTMKQEALLSGATVKWKRARSMEVKLRHSKSEQEQVCNRKTSHRPGPEQHEAVSFA